MISKNIQRELSKKDSRRLQELDIITQYQNELYTPVSPKKPMEFKFDKNNIESFEHPIAIGNTIIEKKSDGNCVHVIVDHKYSEPIRIYSSDSNEWNPKCFPEIITELSCQPSGYYHAEMLGLNPDSAKNFKSLEEFVAVSNRPKQSTKNVTSKLIEQYPLKLDIFDVLRYENKILLNHTLNERRKMLENNIETKTHINLIPQWNINDAKTLHQKFLWAINEGYEGLIAKDPDSLYIPGSRDNDWIKLKEFTTLDLAVLGLYETPESQKAGKLFSAVLVGTYNSEINMFETMGKVKVGSKEDQLEIYNRLKNIIPTEGSYKNVANNSCNLHVNPEMAKITRKIPNQLITYNNKDDIAIIEIKILDVTYSNNWHSCGLNYDGIKAHSLRLPTYKQLRTDKTKQSEITSTAQIHEYYLGAK